MHFTGRKKPYSSIGIKRLKCIRCGAPGFSSWQVCANGGFYVPICKACDVELNAFVLEFMALPFKDELIEAYKEKLRFNA